MNLFTKVYVHEIIYYYENVYVIVKIHEVCSDVKTHFAQAISRLVFQY